MLGGMSLRVPRSIWIAGLFGTTCLAAESRLSETRAVLDKWVETRQLISKTRNDWISDKDMLEQSVQLVDRELASVEMQMNKLSTNNTQVEKERVQADSLLKSSNDALEKAGQFAADFEGKIARLVPRLPQPLQ